jgi:hypothetical protein
MGASLAPLRRVLTYMLLSTVYDKLSDERLGRWRRLRGGGVPGTRPSHASANSSSRLTLIA